MVRIPLSVLTLACFLISSVIGPLPQAGADEFHLPVPGVMVHLSPPLEPPILKGIKVHPDNPFRFDFILDQGDSNPVIPAKAGIQNKERLKTEATKLIKYFLASLTIPEKDLWVNLSPYEKDRIIPQSFGLTEMGRDLLAEDYMLKQITASLIYPEDGIGKKFWARIYEEAEKKFGTTNIPVNTFNKVWIVPEKAVVYENAKAGTAYIVESKLKVMLEQDYLALSKYQRQPGDMFNKEQQGTCPQAGCQANERLKVRAPQGNDLNASQATSALGSQIVREIVIPELTREVNEDKNFSQLRQVYNSLILATWYKKKIKDSILEQVYADKKKVAGVGYKNSPTLNIEAIYQRYLKAFKKGVYNYIKEEQDPITEQAIPRKYFSGGFNLAMTTVDISSAFKISHDSNRAMSSPIPKDRAEVVEAEVASFDKQVHRDEAMSSSERLNLGGERFFLEGGPEAMTPRIEQEKGDNRFVDYIAEKTGKTIEQLWSEVDAKVRRQHYSFQRVQGFVPRDSGPQAAKIYEIFDKVVGAYDRQAKFMGLPQFRGKLFIVDSPEVNAFVFSGHTDVYIHLGMIRELAHFCELSGIPFTEDIIAAVLAHEMRHVMQHSTFEGISWPDLQHNKALANEVLALKRQAEYDADEGGMLLMGMADYNPEIYFTLLQFLGRITRETTLETAISTHPHPKERLLHIQTYYTSDRILPGKKSITPLDTNGFKAWKYNRIGPEMKDVHSFKDMARKLSESKTFSEFTEQLRLLRYMFQILPFRDAVNMPSAQSAFARDIFYNNVLDAMRMMVARSSQRAWKEPSGLNVVKKEGVLAEKLFSQEQENVEWGDQLDQNFKLKGASPAEYVNHLKEEIVKIKNNILTMNIDLEERTRLLDAINALFLRSQKMLINNFNDADSYQRYIGSDLNTEDDWNSVIGQFLKEGMSPMGLDALVSKLYSVPFCVYRTYGRKDLNQEVNAKDYVGRLEGGVDLGFGGDILSDEKVFLERSDSNFYIQDLRLWPVGTLAERKALFDAILRGYVLRFYQESAPMEKIREVIFAKQGAIWDEIIARELLRMAPEFSKRLEEANISLDGDQMSNFLSWLKDVILQEIDLKEKKYGQRTDEDSTFIKYLTIILPAEPSGLFSSIFKTEYDLSEYKFDDLFPGRWHDESDYSRIELKDNEYNAVRAIGKKLQDKFSHEDLYYRKPMPDALWSEIKLLIRGELNHYSIDFRKKTIKHMFNSGTRLLEIDPLKFKELIQGLIYPSDAYDLLVEYASNHLPQEFDKVPDPKNRHALIELCDWLMENRPDHLAEFSKPFMNGYVILKLKDIEDQMKSDYEETHPGESFDKLNFNGFEQMLPSYLSKEEAFDLLSKIASAGQWSMEALDTLWAGKEDHWVKGETSKGTSDEVLKDSKGRPVASQDVPVALFNKISHESSSELLRQKLFRRIFDLSADELGVLTQGQKEVNARLKLTKGRLDQNVEVTNVQKLLDSLLIQKVIEERVPSAGKVSSSDFKDLLTFEIIRDSRDRTRPNPYFMSFRMKMLTVNDRDIFLELGLVKDDPNLKVAFAPFLERLNDLHIIGQYSDMDNFCTALSGSSKAGLELFPIYADWMSEMQIPKPRKEALRASEEPRSYLEALARGVDLEGDKAKVFKKYDSEFSRLLHSNTNLKDRVTVLTRFMKKASLFRDGFIDVWEKKLVPAMELSFVERKVIESLERKQWGESFNEYRLFERTLLNGPLQWEKVNSKDAKGDPVPIKISSTEAKEALDFYHLTIPLVADPQRQLRMGATAMKIFRQTYPAAAFEEELTAIEGFLPFASQYRDGELNKLLDGHEIPDAAMTSDRLDHVRQLFTSYQGMQYDTELTAANSVEQTMKALLSGASRETRLEFLLWVLDPQRNPQPGLLQSVRNRNNIVFDEMPKHISYMSEDYRRKFLEQIFLGENGLFMPHNAADKEVMDKLCERLFETFFPPRDEQSIRSGKQQFTQEAYNMLKEVFTIIIEEYPPARRTSVVLALLGIYNRLGDMSDGEKLALLLAAIGPVGVKVGQVLSENSTLIPNDTLRSQLGNLKSNAEPISKFSVLEVLTQEGISLEDVRIGRRLASASMGQVHAGWLRVHGDWKRVVFKIIRPNIARLMDQDMQVLRKVLEHVRDRYGKDLTNMADNVKEWIDFEGDLRNEAKNTESIRDVIKKYSEIYPPNPGEKPLQVPHVYIGDKKGVLVLEMVEGIEVGKLFGSSETRSAAGIKALLVKKGLPEGEIESLADEISGISRFGIIDQLRRLLLYMFLVDGRFHADLHTDNVMAGKATHLIDLGLTGNFTDAHQREGVKTFLRGIVLHRIEDIMEGMILIHAYSARNANFTPDQIRAQIEAKRLEIEGRIIKIFQQGEDVKHEMLDISSVINEMNFPGNKDFSDFIKALTTAIWLFPTTIREALSTLNSLRNILGLNNREYRQVMRIHSGPVIRQGFRNIFVNSISQAVAPVNNWFQNTKYRAKVLLGKKELIKEVSHNVEQVAQGLSEVGGSNTTSVLGEPLQDHSSGKYEVLGEVKLSLEGRTYRLQEVEAELKDRTLGGDLLESIRQEQGLNDHQVAEIKESSNIFVKIWGLMDDSNKYSIPGINLSPRETILLEASSKFHSEINYDRRVMIAMALTDRIMRHKHAQRMNEGLFDAPYMDYLMPEAPEFRYIAERMADLYLQYLGHWEEYQGKNPAEILNSFEEVLANGFVSSRYNGRTVKINVLKGAHNNVDSKVRYMRHQISDIPEEFSTKLIRDYLSRVEKKVTPDNVSIATQGSIFVQISRTGFADRGRFNVDMVDANSRRMIRLVLTEKEYNHFAKTGHLGPVTVEQWESIVPSSGAEWKRDFGVDDYRSSFVDRAQNSIENSRKGGIDFNSNKINLQVQNNGGEIKFHIDPAMLQQLRNAPGFVPVIINIHPLGDFSTFLGLSSEPANLTQQDKIK